MTCAMYTFLIWQVGTVVRECKLPIAFLIWQVGTVVSECKLPIEVDDYVETFSPILVDLVHAW